MSASAVVATEPGPGADERWRVGAFPASERVEAWRQVVAETHLPWRIARATPAAGSGYDAWVRRRVVGGLSILDCGCDPCAGSRERPEITRTRVEAVAALLILDGRERIAQGGRVADLGPGDLVLWDGARPSAFAVPGRLRKRTLLVPRAELAPRLPRLDRATAVRLRGPAVGLFAAHLQAVLDAPPLDSAAEAAAALAAVELLAAAAAPAGRAEAGSLRAGVLARARAVAERRLGDPRLGPAALAAACGVSPRTLHQAFEEGGESVAAYVRRRRLERCRDDLLGGRAATVAEAALRWGFVSPAHFSRVYRARFGHPPRDALRADAGPTAPSPPR